MSVYKDGSKWRVIYRYTNSRGERKQTQKRGFSTKKEAQAWEREQMNKTESSLDMTFESFSEIYFEDMKKRLKDNTWHTKEHILRTKLIPFFGKRKMCDIQPKDVIAWQNEMLEGSTKTGKPYSPVYLKTLHNQLSAVFNYAVKFYGLPSNPAAKAGNMGKAKNREMLFWTQEEYKQFAEVMMDKPVSFYAFEMLYWCGIREGELLALTPADFDFEKQTVSITKSYQRIKGQDIITDPKTAKSNRVVKMPDFLSQEMQDFIGQLYGTRKQKSSDNFDMISGTNGLLGCADGAFMLYKETRTSNKAILEISGRDQQDQKIHLVRDEEKLCWNFEKAETELWKEPPEPLLECIANLVTEENPTWQGTATELIEKLGLDMKPNVVSLKLNVNAGRLMNDYGIRYTNQRNHSGRMIFFSLLSKE